MGSGKSHFNVSLIVMEQVKKTVHKPQPFWRERRAKVELSQGLTPYFYLDLTMNFFLKE